MATVLSVNVGAAEHDPASKGRTGIAKKPVEQIAVRAPGPKRGGLGSGVVGDFIGSTKHHGGNFQAVYAVAREELDWWGERLGRELPNGMFGENLTTTGLDVDHALVGEQWRIGDALLQVRGPRIPCGTFRMHMQERGWVKTYAARGLSGAYLSVEIPGTIRPGDVIEVVERPEHDIDVPTVFRAFYNDQAALQRVVEAHVLDDANHADLAAKLAR